MRALPVPSLYVHIPFCLRRCIYCDFVSGIYDTEKEVAYIDALKKEIQHVPNEKPLSTVYIGGGTPTALSNHALSDLIIYIFSRLSFAENYEATIEANPGTMDKEKLSAILAAGINRISIGVQSFDDDELNFLGRRHTAEEAEKAVLLARNTGFKNIGIDLLYGIPNQPIDIWRETLKKAVGLKPKHISTYELTVETGTPLHEYMRANPHAVCHPEFISGSKEMLNQACPEKILNQVQNLFGVQHDKKKKFSKQHKLIPLDEDEIIEMYEYTIDYLTSEGFIHYEISNFAMPDYFCRHNLNYWDRGEYYGVGLGAHSFINRKRFCNTADFEDYINTLSENKKPVKEIEDITDDKALSEAIFLGMRKTRGINLKRFYESYGKDILMVYEKEIKSLQKAGLIELKGLNRLNSLNRSSSNHIEPHIRLTRKGLLLSNEIFVKFI